MKPKQKGIWCNMTQKGNSDSLTFEHDGNIIQRSKSGKLLWQSNTKNLGAEKLILTYDGALILVNKNYKIVWTLTGQHKNKIGTKYEPPTKFDILIKIDILY